MNLCSNLIPKRKCVYIKCSCIIQGLRVTVVSEWPYLSQSETPWPPISPLIVVIPCSLYSDHVKLGPCRWPSKGRLITGKTRVLFPISFWVFFLVRPPSLHLCHCLPARSFLFVLITFSPSSIHISLFLFTDLSLKSLAPAAIPACIRCLPLL